jgi:hypothetical protein
VLLELLTKATLVEMVGVNITVVVAVELGPLVALALAPLSAILAETVWLPALLDHQ